MIPFLFLESKTLLEYLKMLLTGIFSPVLLDNLILSHDRNSTAKQKQEGHDGPVSLHWLILGNLFKT